MTALITIFIRLFGIAMLAVVFSCGGGGGSNNTPTTGSLALSISGLPAGTGASVTVTSPNSFSQTVSGAQTIGNLTPGTYTVTATSVLTGQTTYQPQIAVQNVAVSAGATASVSVTYGAGPALRLGLQAVTGASGFTSPVFLTARAGDAALFIVEQGGTIRIVRNGATLATPFLNISATNFSTGGERGLLSMAFDPNYATNRFFYVYYTDANGDIAVDRYTVSATNADMTDPSSVLRIIGVPHPGQSNHNGGLLRFGPDGFLYMATGDGGSAGDPPGNAQNLNKLLGKLLRIDVRNNSLAQPYVVPSSNPFFNMANRRGEIWAAGLRNPWRYAFDVATSRVYIADVGQGAREEVDVASIPTTPTSVTGAGLNYGWNITEGNTCFNTSTCTFPVNYTAPVLDYDHSQGCSVTGGAVYRGSAIPEIIGRYFYSDFCNGFLKSFLLNGSTATEQVDWNITNVGNILSFGEDAQNELYMLSANGTVYRIVKL